jgi:predicted amidophosphoribosyltransferase
MMTTVKMICAACGAKQRHNTIRCEQCGKPLLFLADDAMICDACEGEGFVRGRDPKNPGALVMLPCLECNGSGYN